MLVLERALDLGLLVGVQVELLRQDLYLIVDRGRLPLLRLALLLRLIAARLRLLAAALPGLSRLHRALVLRRLRGPGRGLGLGTG